jgi:hypothetical protein
MYKAKVAVCPEIRTTRSPQSEQHVEFFNFKLVVRKKKNPLGFKRLINTFYRGNLAELSN